MNKASFRCTLLNDIILSSLSASEEPQDSLDYIPGAKFLGIVANQFIANNTPEKEDLFCNLFLKDKLRFGNAYPLINEKVSFPTPSCWYSDKNKISENVYQLHFINKEIRKKLVSDDIQLKQKREGFINLQKEEITEINQQFHLKSAYDKEKRRSKESQMFGYYSLPSGSVWQFDIDYDADIQLSVIENHLLGKKRIGRSRSAEFGLVEIEKTTTSEAIPQNTYSSGETLIYSYSNLCIYNSYGSTTGTPTSEELGLPPGSQILWGKSQIRTRRYQSWNRKRFNRDADRLIIVKGSVFVCQIPNEYKLPEELWLGSHFSEGFGKVLVNPIFLTDEAEIKIPYTKVKWKDTVSTLRYAVIANDPFYSIFESWYSAKNTTPVTELVILEEVFIKKSQAKDKFKGVSSSQWGKIRNYASYAGNKDVLKKLLFSEDNGCLMRGQAQEIWRVGDRIDFMKNLIEEKNHWDDRSIIQYVVRFAAEMAKNTEKIIA